MIENQGFKSNSLRTETEYLGYWIIQMKIRAVTKKMEVVQS